jgi:hypothetical protein
MLVFLKSKNTMPCRTIFLSFGMKFQYKISQNAVTTTSSKYHYLCFPSQGNMLSDFSTMKFMLTHIILQSTLCLPHLWLSTKNSSKSLVKNKILIFIQMWLNHWQGAGAIGKSLIKCDEVNTNINLVSILWNFGVNIHK